VIDQLEIIRARKPLFRGDFKKLLTRRVEERRVIEVEGLLAEAAKINRIGAEVEDQGEKKVMKGYRDAIRYIGQRAPEIIRPATSIRKEGEVTSDTEDFKEDYIRRRDDPTFGQGQHCGLAQMDAALGGARKDQLWTHAGFTGHGKSLFGLNWVYNQAIYFGFSSCYFSLEMPYDQCRRILIAMHSMHEKFSAVRVHHGLQEDPLIPTSLSYRWLRDGVLDASEEEFLLQYVLPDLKECGEAGKYGKLFFQGYDPDLENPFSMMVVDHGLLLDSRGRHRSTTEKANEIIRDLKILSGTFNRGEGMAILNLFQISREGLKRAEKKHGLYGLYDLSYANEVERSSDVVTASYLPKELAKACRMQFQCLKARDDGAFDPFYARIEWNCRRLLTCNEIPSFLLEDQENVAEEIESATIEDLLGDGG
jgi:hypothetical protein